MADVEIIAGELANLGGSLDSASSSVTEAATIQTDLAGVATAMAGATAITSATTAGQSVDDRCAAIAEQLTCDGESCRAAEDDFATVDGSNANLFAQLATDTGYTY